MTVRSAVIHVAAMGLFASIAFLHAQNPAENYPPWPPSSLAGEWSFSTSEAGVLSMSCHFPYGAVVRDLELVVNLEMTGVQEGTVRYPDGDTRKLKQSELGYFWEYAGAKEALALYRKKR